VHSASLPERSEKSKRMPYQLQRLVSHMDIVILANVQAYLAHQHKLPSRKQSQSRLCEELEPSTHLHVHLE
jgi:hypothetical protein